MHPTFGPDINTDDIINIAEPNWEQWHFLFSIQMVKIPITIQVVFDLSHFPQRNILIIAYCLWTADLLRVHNIFALVRDHCTEKQHHNKYEDITAAKLNNPSRIKRLFPMTIYMPASKI